MQQLDIFADSRDVMNVAAVAEVPPVLAGATSATFNASFNGFLRQDSPNQTRGFTR
ncbi:hypothetical protein AB4Y32_38635 [Paraburkholderia phymatum]|uniref:Uncharacterized protein n=1 Tax=Paraburkholderia phymatum TaxID=148447 RepID=A0ACC6UDL0_9BURK